MTRGGAFLKKGWIDVYKALKLQYQDLVRLEVIADDRISNDGCWKLRATACGSYRDL